MDRLWTCRSSRSAPRSPYRLSGERRDGCPWPSRSSAIRLVLVLDEPTFGQDRHGYDGLLAILRDRSDAGTALIVATHDLAARRATSDARRRSRSTTAGW